jgi:hypothetical protein
MLCEKHILFSAHISVLICVNFGPAEPVIIEHVISLANTLKTGIKCLSCSELKEKLDIINTVDVT